MHQWRPPAPVRRVLALDSGFGEVGDDFLDEVGFQTELHEKDFASLGTVGRGREAYVLNPIRNAPIRPSELGLRNTFTDQGSQYHGYEDNRILEMIEAIAASIDPEERDLLILKAFTYTYEQYTDLPMASITAEVTVNPEVVADTGSSLASPRPA